MRHLPRLPVLVCVVIAALFASLAARESEHPSYLVSGGLSHRVFRSDYARYVTQSPTSLVESEPLGLSLAPPGIPGAPGDTVADLVLGQADFIHLGINNLGASGLSLPIAVATDSTGHIYVADACNNRVLGWRNAGSLTTGQPADLVIGQPDFHSFQFNNGTLPDDSSVLGPDSLGLSSFQAQVNQCYPNGAMGIAVDPSGNLYVADILNNRVLEYTSPFADCVAFPCIGPPANLVFGQNGSFTRRGCNDGLNAGDQGGVGPDSLCIPTGVAADPEGNLYIVDTGNGRVLEYDIPLATGIRVAFS